jgi:glycosyltransferase involved in cell wall biosynthesis
MTRPLSISVVTPSFNQAAFIDESIRSVTAQGYDFMEHLVVDGASDDNTVDILRKHSGDAIHLQWTSEPDRGQSSALNKGFALATGDVVGWLNCDDRYRAGCFEYVTRMFQQYPEVDIIYGDYTWMDEAGRVFRVRKEIEFNYFVLLYHHVLYIPSTATFFRRRIFDESNWLDENLHYAMDFEFFVRLASRRYRFLHVPKLLADFRFHQSSKTCTAAHKQLEELERVRQYYSPLLCRLRAPGSRKATSLLLRCCANALRYSEKFLRGYYFSQSLLSADNASC